MLVLPASVILFSSCCVAHFNFRFSNRIINSAPPSGGCPKPAVLADCAYD